MSGQHTLTKPGGVFNHHRKSPRPSPMSHSGLDGPTRASRSPMPIQVSTVMVRLRWSYSHLIGQPCLRFLTLPTIASDLSKDATTLSQIRCGQYRHRPTPESSTAKHSMAMKQNSASATTTPFQQARPPIHCAMAMTMTMTMTG